MKFRTLKRHVREGAKNIVRNGWMMVASVGAVTTTLILVSAFLAVMLNINQMAIQVEEDVEIKALIEVTAEDADVKALGEQLNQLEGVESVAFSSKDEELVSLIDGLGEQGDSWQMFEQDNPLNHAYVVKAEQPEQTAQIAEKIEKLDQIYKVNYGQDVVDKLFNFNEYARTIGIVLIVGLVLTAVFLISNTIKLTIMARSKEIGIMKLVGATNGFIRWPFFVEGMLLGILGSIIPITLIMTGYYFLINNISEFIDYNFVKLLPYNPFAWQLSLIVLVIGIVIGIWGSVMSVRKFLKV